MLIFVCLLVDLIFGFITAISHEKPVGSNSHRLSPLYLQANQLTIALNLFNFLRNRNYTQHWFQKQHIIYSYQIFVTICISPSSTKVFLQLEHHIKLLIDC